MNLDPSSPHTRLHPQTQTGNSQVNARFSKIQRFGGMRGKKVTRRARRTVPFLVLCETPKSLKQQHSPSELKPTGAEAAQDSAPFMGVSEDWAYS